MIRSFHFGVIMAKVFSSIDERLEKFIRSQHMFFVATAPSGSGGHVNLSPKGLDTLRIIDPQTVAYLDLTGSGVETIAHVRQNGRITLMFCAFDGAPKIVRLQGRGEVVERGATEFAELIGLFPHFEGTRSVIRIRLDRIADSCGYGVPLYRHEGARPQLLEWADRKGADGVLDYQREHNTESIDGILGLGRK
jgi:hypothetical protein